MTDIIDRIDKALRCLECPNLLPQHRVSDDFCSDECQRKWLAKRARPLSTTFTGTSSLPPADKDETDPPEWPWLIPAAAITNRVPLPSDQPPMRDLVPDAAVAGRRIAAMIGSSILDIALRAVNALWHPSDHRTRSR